MSETVSYNIMEIMKMIPHRYPFLLVDRITECVPGEYCKGYKNVTMNEEFFCGHFPENPIMPGVLQIEAMAQLSAGILMNMPEYKGKLALFAGIEGARFKNIVRPGDKFEMESHIIKRKGPIGVGEAIATVDGKVAAKGELTFAVV